MLICANLLSYNEERQYRQSLKGNVSRFIIFVVKITHWNRVICQKSNAIKVTHVEIV